MLLITELKSRRFVSTAAILATLILVPTALFGTALPLTDGGILAVGNSAGTLVGITVSPSCINWGGGSTCAGATHTMSVSGASVDFGIGASTIKDISTVPVVGFATVSGAGPLTGLTINFDLTSLPSNGSATVGNCTSNAALNTCTPPLSPFTFSEDITGAQVTIAFDTLMNAYTGASGSGVTAYRARFSTNLSGTLTGAGGCNGVAANITNILTCEAAGGTITATWSATASPLNPSGSSSLITTTSVVSGTVGTPYSQSLFAQGTAPYVWSIIGGRLPPGLNLSTTGQITGTPTYAEISTVTFQVTDSSHPAQTATVTLTITIL